jgi:hypothetical protein
VLLFRYYEHSDEVRQAISVFKRRGGPHERSIRDLRLGPRGIEVGPQLHELRYQEGDKRETLRRRAAALVLLTRSLVNDPHVGERRQEVAAAFDALVIARREFDEVALAYAEAASAERYKQQRTAEAVG